MKKKIVIIVSVILVLIFLISVIINLIVFAKTNDRINNNINYNDYDYVLVLGANVKNGKPSLMLKDRLDKAVEIYNRNKDVNIIISGDSVNPSVYDEIGAMYEYLIINGIEEKNIIKDNYGVNTYNSVTRMKDIIKDNKVIIVTQKYHLYRGLYIALDKDVNAVGISAKEIKYAGQFYRDVREILARVKDFVLTSI